MRGLAAAVLLAAALSGCGGAKATHAPATHADPTATLLVPSDVAPDRCHIERATPTRADADRCLDTLWKRYVEPLGTYSWAYTERETHGRWKAVFDGSYDDSLPFLCIWLGTEGRELVPLNSPPYTSTAKLPC